MNFNIDDEEGEFLVRTARIIVENTVHGQPTDLPEPPKKLNIKAGVFVTLRKINGAERELRGCIGNPMPETSIMESLVYASKAAATDDPRFYPVSSSELDSTLVEVSILSPPELVTVTSPLKYPSEISTGKDGLIIRWALGSGILLPDVAIEYKLNPEDFLSHASMKAGGTPDLWLVPGTRVYKFQTIVFEEEEPRGRVLRKMME